MNPQPASSPRDDQALAAAASALYAPLHDLARSPVARRVASLAHHRGLFLFDYEARLMLELPEHWLPVGRPDLGVTGDPPGWHRGLLGESKYLAFRHDHLLGSLHAGHRAKWTAHELLHGLVGFSWRPDASALYHALAARLAEVLPVAVWYFYDECGLSRCERHRHQTEVGPGYCPRCEDAQAAPPRELDDADRDFVLRGRAFVKNELMAVRAAIRDRQPHYRPHGAVDLMADGLAYAAAHLPRLRAPETASFMAHFFPEPGAGRFDTLEAFIAHIETLDEDLAAAALGESRPPDLAAALGRDVFVAQDLGMRLAQLAADTDGECHAELMTLVARLGAASRGGHEQLGPAIADTLAAYGELHADFELPSPDEVFAVGYPLGDGLGLAQNQLIEGLRSACGTAIDLLERDGRLEEAFTSFLAARAPSRRPLGRRFLDHLRTRPDVSPDTAALAALEVAITTALPPDPEALTLAFDAVELGDSDTLGLAVGVELVRCGFDAGGLLMHGAADPDGPRDFLVRRDAGDQVGLVALTPALAERLATGPLPAHEVFAKIEAPRPDPELSALVEECLLVARRHSLTTDT